MAKKDIVLKFGADLAPFNKATNRSQQRIKALEKQVGKLTGKLGRMQQVSQKAGQSFERTGRSSGELLSRMKSMIGPAAALTAGVLAVTMALRPMGTEATEAKDRLLGLQDPTKKLQQIAPTLARSLNITVEQAFLQLQKQARDIAKTGIAGGEEAAIDVIFNTFSASAQGELKTIIESAKFVDPTSIAQAIGAFQSPAVFGKAAGTGPQILSQLALAGPRSAFTIEETVKQATRLAPFAKNAGVDLTDLLATLSQSSFGFIGQGGPERQSTAVTAVLKELFKGGPAGEKFTGTIVEQLQQFQSQFPEGFAARQKGNIRFTQGAGPILGSAENINLIRPEIRAERESIASLKSQLRIADLPSIAGPRLARGATERRAQTAAAVLGPRALGRERAIDLFASAALENQKFLREAGETSKASLAAFTRGISLIGLRIDAFLEVIGARDLLGFDTGGQSVAQLALEGARVRAVSPELNAQILKALQAIEGNTRTTPTLRAIETNTRDAGGIGLVTDVARATAHREGDR